MIGPAFYPDVRRERPIYLSGVECVATRVLEERGCDIGLLLQPDSHLHDKALHYRLWAADNGCFARGDSFDADEWFAWVQTLVRPDIRFGCWGHEHESRVMDLGPGPEGPEAVGCLFVAAPDVMCDPEATWRRSEPWLGQLRELGFPAALVAQDGCEDFWPMWDWDESDASHEWDCLFLGGSTDWKLSRDARDVAAEARGRGKWVHMGRVNSWQRLALAAHWAVDSVDGTYLAFGPDLNGVRLARWLDELAAPKLFATHRMSA